MYVCRIRFLVINDPNALTCVSQTRRWIGSGQEAILKKVFRNIGVPTRSCGPQNQKDQVYYEEKVALKSDKSFDLCFLTIPQRLCTLWYDERDKRFTGTTVRNCSYLRF